MTPQSQVYILGKEGIDETPKCSWVTVGLRKGTCKT